MMPPNYRLYNCMEKIPHRVAIVPVTPSSSQEAVIPCEAIAAFLSLEKVRYSLRIALRLKRLLLVH
jgi:hypothetical protein